MMKNLFCMTDKVCVLPAVAIAMAGKDCFLTQRCGGEIGEERERVMNWEISGMNWRGLLRKLRVFHRRDAESAEFTQRFNAA